MPTYNTIPLEYNGNDKEGTALVGINGFFPGMAVGFASENTITTLDTDGTVPVLAVLIEQSLLGETVNDAYATDDIVQIIVPASGDMLAMRVEDSATDITQGDVVTVDETGYLTTVAVPATAPPTSLIGIAMETSDTSAGDDLIKVMVR